MLMKIGAYEYAEECLVWLTTRWPGSISLQLARVFSITGQRDYLRGEEEVKALFKTHSMNSEQKKRCQAILHLCKQEGTQIQAWKSLIDDYEEKLRQQPDLLRASAFLLQYLSASSRLAAKNGGPKPPRCFQCLERRTLQKSHIVPNAILRWLKAHSRTGQMVQDTSVWHYLLCDQHEQEASVDEGYFFESFFKPYADDSSSLTEVPYEGPYLIRFVAIVMLRVLASLPGLDNDFTVFDELRTFLNTQSGGTATPRVNLHLFLLPREVIRFSIQGINVWNHLGLGWGKDTIQGKQLLWVKLPLMLLVCSREGEHGWEDSRLNGHSGRCQQLELPQEINELLRCHCVEFFLQKLRLKNGEMERAQRRLAKATKSVPRQEQIRQLDERVEVARGPEGMIAPSKQWQLRLLPPGVEFNQGLRRFELPCPWKVVQLVHAATDDGRELAVVEFCMHKGNYIAAFSITGPERIIEFCLSSQSGRVSVFPTEHNTALEVLEPLAESIFPHVLSMLRDKTAVL